MNATRLVRKPFVSLAYRVTEQNMEVLAKWCGGEIIQADDRKNIPLHISVTASRPSPKSLTEARVGFWIVGSFHHRRKSFKVYNDLRLDREFDKLTEDDNLCLQELEIDPKEFEPQPPADCCAHCKMNSVPRQLPSIPQLFKPVK